ncbi:MAG: dethiobiotin synthase [Balneolaceae bacterium]
MKPFPKELFVTGTDTGIGKTVVSAMLTIGLKAGYWKPVQSGLEPETDTQFVRRATGLPDTHFYDEAYRLTEPMSPHASAAIDGVEIEMEHITLPYYQQNHLIVEGAGGLLVPINGKQMIIDLIRYLKLPVLLVARSSLGTLNHTFLSLEALRRRNIPVWGVILSGEKHPSNEEAIRAYGKVKHLYHLPVLDEVQPEALQHRFQSLFNTK